MNLQRGSARNHCLFIFIQGDFESCADILITGRTPQ
jgi:hypothetical protein